jgi:hypothetical protein
VVTRSFESRRKDGKITNMIFNEWINEYKSKSVSVEGKPVSLEGKSGSVEGKSGSVEGKVEAMSEEKMEVEHRSMGEGYGRRFTPIILTKNY